MGECPSFIAGGREDRCGRFQFPPSCSDEYCRMPDRRWRGEGTGEDVLRTDLEGLRRRLFESNLSDTDWKALDDHLQAIEGLREA